MGKDAKVGVSLYCRKIMIKVFIIIIIITNTSAILNKSIHDVHTEQGRQHYAKLVAIY